MFGDILQITTPNLGRMPSNSSMTISSNWGAKYTMRKKAYKNNEKKTIIEHLNSNGYNHLYYMCPKTCFNQPMQASRSISLKSCGRNL
jgi:hypothetical protein